MFNHHYEDLYFFPWERKRPKAFMRASQQGCMEPNSTRAVLAALSEDHPDRCGAFFGFGYPVFGFDLPSGSGRGL